VLALDKEQGRYTEAEPLYLEALDILRSTSENTNSNLASSLSNLALLYQVQRRYREAEPLFLESLEILRNTLRAGHHIIASGLNNLAIFYVEQARYREAEPLYIEVLEILQVALGSTHPDLATSFSNLATLYQSQGKKAQAINAFRQGLDIEEINLNLNLLTLAESQRQAYTATVNSSINQALSVHLQNNPENTNAAHLALTTLLRRKGRILDAAANSLQTLRQQLTPEDQTLLDDLAAVRSQLSALLYRASDLPTDAYKAEFARLKAEENNLEATLARRSAAFRVESEPVTIEAVQAQIPNNTMLVELVRYTPYDFNNLQDPWSIPRYAAYLLGPTGTPQAVDLGEAEAIDRAAASFSRALRNPTLPPNEAAQALYDLIFAPLQAQLGSAQHLLISPDSQLNQIPFEALMDSQQRYLVESYQISYLASGRDLLKLQLNAPHQQPPVLIAAPDYDGAAPRSLRLRSGSVTDRPEDIANHPENIINRSLSEVERSEAERNRRSSELSQFQFGDLPGTAAEAAAIAPLLGVTPLTGDRATENLLKQIDSPQILHVATHGFFLADLPEVAPTDFSTILGLDLRTPANIGLVPHAETAARPTGPVENPLLRSGLALAGANRRESGDEDGILTALEAASLDLYGTQLVVLSACETGLGDVANGEGVYGLRRSLGIAGAESQMISLWQVSDRATESLMVNYYEALLAGGGRSDALRQVQLDMLQSERYAHPYYWAAFIVSGDWRPLADE
ncbi:MAG: CHAT domain-containing protein, partial [Leptolyngbya sp. SIO4C5]|nr:CHAT domain-containing protein [Leptolyngbya sp. SIO4C5]